MKRYLMAATAMAAVMVATPATARDHTAYFGLEIGPMWVQDSHVRFPDFTGDGSANFDVDHKLGVDGDLIAGYDFGMIRAELEGAHKWAKHDKYSDDFDSVDADGHSRAYSLMGNVLFDLGKDDSFNFYAGGGVGMAWVRQKFDVDGDSFSIHDSNLAWQAIVGFRAPVFVHFDIGLKYRYFSAGKIKDDFEGDTVHSRFRSHSLLASLIYNFGAPEAPPPPPVVVEPPPPPPPPATQTCPDGSVILATDACPVPPPLPPPPPPEPERG